MSENNLKADRNPSEPDRDGDENKSNGTAEQALHPSILPESKDAGNAKEEAPCGSNLTTNPQKKTPKTPPVTGCNKWTYTLRVWIRRYGAFAATCVIAVATIAYVVTSWEQVVILRKSIEASERPWISIIPADLPEKIPEDYDGPITCAKWQNVGKSPAMKFQMDFGRTTGSNPISKEEIAKQSSVVTDRIIMPTEHGDVACKTPWPWSEEFSAVREHQAVRYLYGTMTYCDQFGVGYLRKFCFNIGTKGEAAGACPHYNEWQEKKDDPYCKPAK